MKYCSACAAELELRIPDGDDRERHVCTRCGAIHYQNPKVVVGCIVEHEGQLLLCRRSIEPAYGRWTFPAGFQELGETTVQGAVRETREEACAEVEVIAPFAYLDIPHISQAYMIYRTRLAGSFAPGAESLEVALVPAADIPWDELAFPTIRFALELHATDTQRGIERAHFGTVLWNRQGSRYEFTSYRLEDHRTVP